MGQGTGGDSEMPMPPPPPPPPPMAGKLKFLSNILVQYKATDGAMCDCNYYP